LRVRGRVPGAPNSAADSPVNNRGFVWLTGRESNTFTGKLFVNDANCAVLNKLNGATAVRGDIVAANGGVVGLERGHQIADTSIVTLDGRVRSAGLHYETAYYEIVEKFHQLVVMGDGSLLWGNAGYGRALYLDDLMIETGGSLLIKEYQDGVTFLLVRKGSANLSSALNRIKFRGRREPKASIANYNADYWQVIPGFPEPTTYGAILASASCAFALCRRKTFVAV